MKKFGKALMAGLKVAIVGVVFLVAGITLIAIAEKEVLTYVGYGCIFIAFVMIFIVAATFRQTMDQYCTVCQKKYTDGDECSYSYVCNEYKDNFDSNGNYKGTTYYFSINVTCPHCGVLNTISFKTTAKNMAIAEQTCNKYINNNVLKSKRK